MKFNAAGGASGEANNAAAALLAEVPLEDLLMAEWHNSIMRPCHYLALDRRRKRLVLSIRCVPAAPHYPLDLASAQSLQSCEAGGTFCDEAAAGAWPA